MRWIWLSIFGAVFFGAAWGAQNLGWEVFAAVLGLIMLIFVLGALAEFLSHYGEINSNIFERRQRAMNTTPVVMIAEALRGLHPENVRVLNKFAVRTVWDVKVDLERGERDWMLQGTNVHFGFVEFVLDNSRNGQLYPRNKFLEGSRKWDPDRIVDDREQHRQFELWLSSRFVVIREFGENHPAVFLPPWTPELLKQTMGFEGPQDLYQPDEQMVLKNLEAQSKPATVASTAQPRKIAEKPLSDDEIRNLEDVQAAHDRKYGMSPSEYLQLKNGQSN